MTGRGIDMWGDPPPCADDVELAEWVAEALGGETAILDLLRSVADGEGDEVARDRLGRLEREPREAALRRAPLDLRRHLAFFRERPARRQMHQHECSGDNSKKRGDREKKAPDGLSKHPNVLFASAKQLRPARETLLPWKAVSTWLRHD